MSRGAFENCFATGLDLSEFQSPDSSSNNNGKRGGTATNSSAAAELLRVKQIEREQREREEAKDTEMEQMVNRQLSALSRSLTKPTKKMSSKFELVDALVQMHGSDADRFERTSRKTSRKQQQGREKSSSRRLGNGAKSVQVIKGKSSRSKY